MLLSLDLNEQLINEESVTISLVFSSQPLSILRPKLIAPKTNSFVAHLNATM
jgi:hypothetical protein